MHAALVEQWRQQQLYQQQQMHQQHQQLWRQPGPAAARFMYAPPIAAEAVAYAAATGGYAESAMRMPSPNLALPQQLGAR